MNERATFNMPNQIQMMLNGSIPPPPIAKLIGFKLVSISSGKAVIEFEADEKHANPMGTLHGGVLCDISDAAMGMAYASMLKEGESFTTLELKINFLKPIWNRAIHLTQPSTICSICGDGNRLPPHAFGIGKAVCQ